MLEDLTGSHGHSEQSVDTGELLFFDSMYNTNNQGTTNIQIEKAVLRGKEYFIMDTPGFDPGNEETTFIEITRGINAVSAFARVIGMLFLNCINQPRFDAFDRKLASFIRTLSGNEFFPRVTFVTTFWTPVNAKQQTAFNQRLASLRQNWQMSASTQEQQSYQHGHVYSEGGEDTGSFLNWFESRDQIAQYAREIIGRRSEGSNAQRNHNCYPDIVKELCAGTRLQDTEAGRLLGIAPPNPNPNSNSDTSSHESDSSPSNGSSQEQPEEAAAPTNTGSATETESYSQTSFGNLLMEGVSWFFRNVNFDVNFGGAGPGGQTFGNSQPRGKSTTMKRRVGISDTSPRPTFQCRYLQVFWFGLQS